MAVAVCKPSKFAEHLICRWAEFDGDTTAAMHRRERAGHERYESLEQGYESDLERDRQEQQRQDALSGSVAQTVNAAKDAAEQARREAEVLQGLQVSRVPLVAPCAAQGSSPSPVSACSHEARAC